MLIFCSALHTTCGQRIKLAKHVCKKEKQLNGLFMTAIDFSINCMVSITLYGYYFC